MDASLLPLRLFTLFAYVLFCKLGLFEVVDRRAKLVADELSDEQSNIPPAGIDFNFRSKFLNTSPVLLLKSIGASC